MQPSLTWKTKILLALTFSFATVLYSPTLRAEEFALEIPVLLEFSQKYDTTAHQMFRGMEAAYWVMKQRHPALKVTLKKYGHRDDLEKLLNLCEEVSAEGYPIVIGGEDSHHAMAMARVFSKNKVLFISPTATNPQVVKGNDHAYLMSNPDTIVARRMAEFAAKTLKDMPLGVFHNVSYPYTDFFSQRFIERFERASLTRVIHQKVVSDTDDFSKVIEVFRKAGVKTVAIFSYENEVMRFLSQAHSKGYFPNLIGADGWGDPRFFRKKAFPKKSSYKFQAFQSSYWHKESKDLPVLEFRKRYRQIFGEEPNAWNAIGYDTVMVAVSAFLRATDDKRSIKDSLQDIRLKELATARHFSFTKDRTPVKETPVYVISKNSVDHRATLR